MEIMTMAIDKKENPKRQDVHKMFDRISGRYDLLNRLLSMRRDVAWRKKVAALLPDKNEMEILDLATGTGDLLLSLNKHNPNIKKGLGIDLAEQMLKIAEQKISKLGLSHKLSLLRADAVELPLGDQTFDAVTISFGIRNVTDVSKSLKEMHRLLRENGKALILEFSLPKNSLMRKLYLFYFRKILPAVGSVISGDAYAYRYLNQTVESFPYGQEFCDLMSEAGFSSVKAHPLTFGIATIYEGTR